MNYNTTYCVRIISAPNNLVWYSKRIGQVFEATREGKGNKVKYKIGYLLSIPALYCEVVKEIKQPKYTKY